MTQILEVRGARRVFKTPEGGTVAALDGVDLDVGQNEFVTLLGPSGCGKTTLLRSISGFEQLDSGTLMLDGKDIGRMPAFRRPVNTVFQSYALFSHMTVERNVAYSLEVAGASKQEQKILAGEALEMVGLSGTGSRMPSQLSGGQRQRVALARAIVARPKLLLLDEPLSALDRRLRQKMQIELKALQSELGIAFVFVTHDQEEALTMSDRIVVMRGGQIEQCGAPRDIFRKPRTKFVAEFIGDTNLFETTIECVHDGRILALTREGTKIWLSEETKRAKGDAATVVIRPTDLQVQDAHSSCGFRGKITRVIYLGTDLHYYVQPAVGGQELLVVSRTDGSRRAPGDEVTLTYRPERAHVVEDC
ncbi:spermidine/putrescine transport system ATP-binding protein [Ruegeria sp. P4]|nr:spermidine/putrescine transport system ATP-binding protein [Ruegeria sp. P4]